jgi:hypothetical protein
MTISNLSREKLNWLLFEGLLIVISILMAFWIDAWWSDRQIKADEEQVLTSLLDDFSEKRARVDGQRDYIDAILSSTKKLLYSSTESTPELSSLTIDQLFGDIWWNLEASIWTAPLLDSVVSGGDLDLISNRQLRIELLEWSERFNRIEESVEREIDFYDERLMPFIEANADLRQILNVIEHAPGFPEVKYEYGEKFSIQAPLDHTKLLMNREFQGLLVRRSVLLNDILTQRLAYIDDELDELITTIEAELSK